MQTTDSNPAAEVDLSNLFVGIMEGYTDSVIPPLLSEYYQAQVHHGQTYCINEKGGSSSSKINPRKRNSSGLHIEIEKKRRDKIAEMYSILQSMVVPNHIAKMTRETIVSSTIEHIQKLEKEVARLEDLKKKKMNSNSNMVSPETMEAKPLISRCCTYRSSSVEVSVYGGLTFFGIQLPNRCGSLAEMFRVFERYQVEVLAANVAVAAVDRRQLTVAVTAAIGGNRVEVTIEKIKGEILVI